MRQSLVLASVATCLASLGLLTSPALGHPFGGFTPHIEFAESVVRVLLNDGAGSFALQPQAYPAGNGAGLSVADVDSDGDPDLVAGHSFDDEVVILLNNGDATFMSPLAYPVGDAVRSIVVADWDGDWDVDVATANAETGDSVSVLLNRTGQLPVGDLDGDGCVGIVDFLKLLKNWNCE